MKIYHIVKVNKLETGELVDSGLYFADESKALDTLAKDGYKKGETTGLYYKKTDANQFFKATLEIRQIEEIEVVK